jgi:hypothetical protein
MPAEPIATPSRSARPGDGRGWWRNGVIHRVFVRGLRGRAADGVEAQPDDAAPPPADWYRLEVDR